MGKPPGGDIQTKIIFQILVPLNVRSGEGQGDRAREIDSSRGNSMNKNFKPRNGIDLQKHWK